MTNVYVLTVRGIPFGVFSEWDVAKQHLLNIAKHYAEKSWHEPFVVHTCVEGELIGIDKAGVLAGRQYALQVHVFKIDSTEFFFTNWKTEDSDAAHS